MSQRIILAGLLLLPALLVFAPGLHYPFVAIDDVHHVVENPAIRDLSWSGIRFLFDGDTRDLRYFPVSYLSFAIDYRLFGLDPFHFRLTNLLLHLANTLLVARVIELVFRDRALGFWTALLFSIHPLQVESVVWVMSRKNVLFLFFFLLSVLAYLKARERQVEGRSGAALLGASAVAYLIACLAKTAAVPLPATLFVIDLAREPGALRRPLTFLRGSLPSKLPYLLPGAIAVFLSVRYEAPNPFRTDFGFTVLEWAFLIGHNFVFYLEKSVLPIALSPFVPLPDSGALPRHFAPYALLSLLLPVVALWSLWRERPILFFGVSWYLVTIAPNACYALFFSDLPILVADRYYYQSAIGVLMLPAAAGLFVWRTSTRARPIVAGAAFALGVALFLLAFSHRAHWRSTRALYELILAHYPNDEFAYRLALEEEAAGRTAEAFAALDAAKAAPQKIFFMDFLFYRLQLARLLLAQGDVLAAADQVEAAIDATPNEFEAFDARTRLAYGFLAELRDRAGDSSGALRAREAAARARPDPGDDFLVEWLRTMPIDSRRYLEAHLAANPEDAEAWRAYAILAQLAGDEREARERYATATRLRQRAGAAPDGRGP